MTLADVLILRDRVALLDGAEDPDSDAGCCAAEVLALHNAIVTGEFASARLDSYRDAAFISYVPDDAA